MRFKRQLVVGLWVSAMLAMAMPAAAQPVAVNSAEPNFGEQESVGLQVRVKGKGFNQGARAEFLLDDNSTGGITVQSTVFVSSTELLATIDIAAGASLSLFDIRVVNLSGRTGRGSDLFQVVEKGARGGGCTPDGVPAGFVQLATLNPAAGLESPVNMAIDMKVAPVTVNGASALMAAVTSGPRVEVYFVSASGVDGVDVDEVNPHRTLVVSNTTRLVQSVAVGDVNGDGTPDVVAADFTVAALFLGQQTSGGPVTFSAPIYLAAAGEPAINVGRALAIGNLDPGVAGDEIVVTQTGQKGGKTGTFLPVAHIYSVSGTAVTKLRSIRPTVSPAMTYDEGFGYSIAVADVFGSGDLDLVSTSRKRGQVWIFPGPSLDADGNNADGYQPVVASGPTFQVAAGDVDGIAGAEILATTSWGSFPSSGDVLRGLISDPVYAFEPEQGGLAKGWSTKGVTIADLNGDGRPDLVVGAPNAEPSTACPNMGAAYVFLGQENGGWDRRRLNPTTYNGSFNAYGWSVAFGTVEGRRLLLVGEQGADVNGVDNAGQVYVYRVDAP
jgi:hypothetical protein